MNTTSINTRIHDGVAGGLVAIGVLLGAFVNIQWLWLPGILGVTMLQSAFTGFCPVYYTLFKLNKAGAGTPSSSAT